jgi:hypothetical protein
VSGVGWGLLSIDIRIRTKHRFSGTWRRTTVHSLSSVEAVQARLIWRSETVVVARPVGTDGAIVSGGGPSPAGVVTLPAVEAALVLAAGSIAVTV